MSDNWAMYATINYKIGSHDHRIAYSFGHDECTKVSEEVVYGCLLGITHHKATISPNVLAWLIILLVYKII